ncbi:Os02g0474450 [Oryza sativa Japonica Group]|uniref:Os02g0474450 protein n=1 Tax=Oryza sativa subsp. japonica TaxID=39947 RepID=A0A0P0VIY1_ORYSJ|nr:Os02g0474450 [Oryza sativa Japonica Group]
MAMVRWRPVGLEVERRGGARGEAGVEDTVDRVEEEVERVRRRRRKRLASIITASYFGCPSTPTAATACHDGRHGRRFCFAERSPASALSVSVYAARRQLGEM